jgi:protein-L-isoaspartate(D-aspartate) O-methyltransferase
MTDNKALVDYLIQKGVLKNSCLKKAFLKIDRAFFVPPTYRSESYGDYPLPIGHGATISQPYTVAFMLELLAPQLGEKILDVGSGSGWTTVLLGEIVGSQGKVFGVEIVPELVKFSQENIGNFNIKNIKIFQAQEKLGLAEYKPFDKILVSASADTLEKSLLQQLKAPGIMVIPIHQSIWKITKNSQGKIFKKEYPGFVFVPLKKQSNN